MIGLDTKYLALHAARSVAAGEIFPHPGKSRWWLMRHVVVGELVDFRHDITR